MSNHNVSVGKEKASDEYVEYSEKNGFLYIKTLTFATPKVFMRPVLQKV